MMTPRYRRRAPVSGDDSAGADGAAGAAPSAGCDERSGSMGSSNAGGADAAVAQVEDRITPDKVGAARRRMCDDERAAAATDRMGRVVSPRPRSRATPAG